MATFYKYRVRCTTESAFKEWILDSTLPVPTTCPSNTAHTVDTVQTTIMMRTLIKDTITVIPIGAALPKM